jgi:hypothetical protein
VKYWSDKCEVALEKVTSLPANSAEATSATARLIPVMLKFQHHHELAEPHGAFIQSFAADVKRFLVPYLRDEVGGKSNKPQVKSAGA